MIAEFLARFRKSAPRPRPARRSRRRWEFPGLEALEGRRPMTGDLGITTVTAPAEVATLATAVPTEYELANDAFLSYVLYSTPGRMASKIAASGAVGVNADWENGLATTWYIEQQRYGADFVQAGLVRGDAALVQNGWKILDWGFAREAADGSFPGSGDAFHSTSMFVEAASRALLLTVQSGSADAPQLVAKYLPKIDASARWLINPTVAAKGDTNDAPYTHRRWLLAAALGQTAALDHDEAIKAAADDVAAQAIAYDTAAAGYAERGLALQTPDGMNPEKGGGDVSYQAYGILLAERYLTVCPDPSMRDRLLGMIVKALDWEMNWIAASGQVFTAGSTRTGVEVSWGGTTKTVDYKTIIQAFSVATTLTGDTAYRDVARAVASGRGWKVI